MGGTLRDFRGVDRHLCQGRRRKHQFRPRDLHSHLLILLTLALIVYATGQFENPTSIAPRTYLFLVLSGLATGASWLCYFRALKLGNASQVAPVDKLSVVLVAIFGALLLGEKLTMLNWLGVALIAFGAVMVAL